jgi:hypothetical protein
MGFYEHIQNSAPVLPVDQGPVPIEPSPQEHQPAPPTSRSRPLLLLAGAGGAYLAIGFALTLDMPSGRLAVEQMNLLAEKAPSATAQDRSPTEESHGVDQLLVAEDIRSLMADDVTGAELQAPSPEAPQLMVASAVPLLTSPAAAAADPAVEASAAPVPVLFQTVAMLAEISPNASLPDLPAPMMGFLIASPSPLGPPSAPDLAALPDVSRVPSPGFVWPAELELASLGPVLSMAQPGPGEGLVAPVVYGFPDLTRGALQPAEPMVWTVPDRQQRVENVFVLFGQEQERGGGSEGCAGIDCLASIPLALAAPPPFRRLDMILRRAGMSSTAVAEALPRGEGAIGWRGLVGSFSGASGSPARVEQAGSGPAARDGGRNDHSKASGGARDGGASRGRGQGSDGKGAGGSGKNGGEGGGGKGKGGGGGKGSENGGGGGKGGKRD